VTAGTVSNPLFHDDNSGRQLAGRVELRPVAGLVAGASLARGPFLSRTAARVATGNLADGHDTQFTQTAWGADLEYSRDHYLIRFETIASAWRLPAVGQPALPSSLDALSTSIEGRYKLRPRLYVAARVDNLAFSDVTGTTATLAWDAPVSRVEVAAGYSLQRNLVLKLAYQYNKRGAGKELPEAHLPAVQLAFWF
jgi:predicted porin